MRAQDLLEERRYFVLLFRLAGVALVVLVVTGIALRYVALRQQALLPLPEEPDICDLLNENTCASTRCHPALLQAPITSRHAGIACVTCHGQRRSHAAECLACHDQVRHHSTVGASETMDASRMDEVRAEMEARHRAALDGTDPGAAAAFPAPVPCLTCHNRMAARPLTFPQVNPGEHLPADKGPEDCADCHRAHDPKPLLAHPLPAQSCQVGRECCQSCHDRTTHAEQADGDLAWVDESFQQWAHDTFGDDLLQPPEVDHEHGHRTVECIACHGEPPTFETLARRVHGFELDTVRCGRCHTGATIIDQQVMHQRMAAEASHGSPVHP